jgi:hypothetical protein
MLCVCAQGPVPSLRGEYPMEVHVMIAIGVIPLLRYWYQLTNSIILLLQYDNARSLLSKCSSLENMQRRPEFALTRSSLERKLLRGQTPWPRAWPGMVSIGWFYIGMGPFKDSAVS